MHRHRIVGAAAALALLPLPLVAGAAPAAAELPTRAVVKDFRGDSDSRRFDVYWVRGAKSGKNLVVTMKVRNLTRKNTRTVEESPGVFTQYAIFGFYLRVNGQKTYAYTLTNGMHGQARLANERTGDPSLDCTPADGYVDNGTRTRFNYDRNTVRLTVPISCLPRVRRVAVSGYAADWWGGLDKEPDAVNKRGTRQLRYTSWFKIR
jgi:hypothetical protein